jgi:hypothetical protein
VCDELSALTTRVEEHRGALMEAHLELKLITTITPQAVDAATSVRKLSDGEIIFGKDDDSIPLAADSARKRKRDILSFLTEV